MSKVSSRMSAKTLTKVIAKTTGKSATDSKSTDAKFSDARSHGKIPRSIPLTPKEKLVLEFLEHSLSANGVAPSYQEICDHFHLASFNSVQNYLKQLSNKGYISTSSHQRRAIRILKSSQAVANEMRSLLPDSPPETKAETLSIPLLGKVAAGQPLEAFTHDEFLNVPSDLLRPGKDTFALRVSGSSMIDEGIFDKDLILVQTQNFAKNGDLVVASVNGEATVKRFYAKAGEIELRPANANMNSMWYSSSSVEVKGIVVGLMRKF